MPILLIGTQRSGSNMLRLMLDQSPSITAPHPPHILERLSPLLHGYGDLSKNMNFAQLVDDVCELVETNPVPWDLPRLDRDEVARRSKERSIVDVYGVVHDMLASAKGVEHWFCKSLANVHYLNDLESNFGETAMYLHLHRDPRDVALSFRKAIVGEKTWYHIALQWHREQQKAIAFQKTLPENRFLSVPYADLTRSPARTLKMICEFIGISFTANMLEFHKSDQAVNTATAGALWENVGRPVMDNNFNKFLKSASLSDISIIESVAKESMDALGYPRACENWVLPTIDQAAIEVFAKENAALKAKAFAEAKPQDLLLRKRQDKLMNSIGARFA